MCSHHQESPRPRVVVAGASGFVGRALCSTLAERFEVIALSRDAESAQEKWPELQVSWRSCDLYSLTSVEQATEGADFAVYLVHSMLKSNGLTQARFDDLDLLLADNFSRACAKAGVKQISYLGGLIPRSGQLSEHLQSRLEVENVLRGHGVPVTVLRAGMVIGAEGPSFRILRLLVSRLPIMVLPSWTSTLTTPIALRDAVELLSRCVGNQETFGVTSDIAAHEVHSYREMLELTAEILGHSRKMVKVPFLSPRLSTLWVSTVTGSPSELVRPLIASLECEMVAENRTLQERWNYQAMGIRDALTHAIYPPEVSPRREPTRAMAPRKGSRSVRSVQRLSAPKLSRARHIAQEYKAWLQQRFTPLLSIEGGDNELIISLRLLGVQLLHLRRSETASRNDREVYQIMGGVLAREPERHRGRFEFRHISSAGSHVAALHDYHPRLPWPLYRLTQARLHLWVMRAFTGHLESDLLKPDRS